jgi:flagellar protein FlaJ
MLCYIFGKYIDKKPQEDIAKSLYQADLIMTPGMFMSLAIVTASFASLLVFLFSLLFFRNSSSPLIYIGTLTFLTFGLTVSSFPFMLYNTISNKNMNIEHELPFALGYMTILASSGSSPMDVIRTVAIESYGDISIEFGKVMYRVDVLGEDGVSAMNHLIRNTSSEALRTICIDLANSMQSGGGLRTYLDMKSRELMDMRRKMQQEFVDSLSVYGEGYLSGVVMSVVLVVLMIVVTSALGIDLGPMTAKQMFQLFVYFLLPFINIVFLILLWMKYSRSIL